jgi:hypothetical protein
MEEGERQLVRISAVCTTYSYQLDYSIERGAGGDTITAINPSISDRYNVSIQTANGFSSYLQLDYVGGTAVAETWSIMAERQQLL